MLRHRLVIVALLVMLAVMVFSGTADACPMCNDALENGKTASPESNLSKGFAYSVYFMLPVPFLIMGGFGYLIHTALRQDAASLEDLPSDEQ